MNTMQYTPETDTLACSFQGRLDSSACEDATERFRQAWDAARAARTGKPGEPAIVFDLADADFLGSAFFRLCLLASRKGASSFRIVRASPTFKKLFAVAGLDFLAE